MGKSFELYNEGERYEGNVSIGTIAYENKANGFLVYDVKDEEGCVFRISGVFVEPLIRGAVYSVCGKVLLHQGQKQLKNVSASLLEESPLSISRYLESLDGSFAAFSNEIANAFKEKTIYVIKNNHEELMRCVPSLTIKDCELLRDCVILDEKKKRAEDLFLSFNLSKEEIKDIFNKYGDQITNNLEECVYFLSGKKEGITFELCDSVALPKGFRLNSFERIKYGILYAFYKEAQNRNTYIKKIDMFKKVSDVLTYYLPLSEKQKIKEGEYVLFSESYKVTEVTKDNIVLYKPKPEDLTPPFKDLLKNNNIVVVGDRYYLKEYYEAEKRISEKIKTLQSSRMERKEDILPYLEDLCSKKGYVLEAKQKKAILGILKYKSGVFCLNGGPGTGKTFLINIIISILDSYKKKNKNIEKVSLLAPTGRAAQIISLNTGQDAKTIHRKLGIISDSINEKTNYLYEDVIIVDECSMIDTKLAAKLFKALCNDNALVILVGDVNQLPAIGAGNFFSDLIDSGVCPVYTLDVVKRQEGLSSIISNASQIITGGRVKSDKEKGDALFIKLKNPPAVLKRMESLYLDYINKWGLSTLDIQILTPTKIGGMGSDSINAYVQNIVNPKKDNEIQAFYKTVEYYNKDLGKFVSEDIYLRKGDKVINTINNYEADWYEKRDGYYKLTPYDKGVYNGEIGIVEEICTNVKYGENYREVYVNFGDKYVLYSNLAYLELAYALTVHKAQGSQWPIVIIPIVKSKGRLTRNLFYTAVTRAQENICVLGQEDEIELAIATEEPKISSGLKYMLRGE